LKNETFYRLYKSLSLSAEKIIDRAKMTEHTFMIIVAIIIGLLAGLAAILIRTLIFEISNLSFSGSGTVLENIISTPWFWVLLVPVLGGLVVGPLIYFFAPEAKGHGVPEVMQAILLKGGRIRPRVALVKALASAITIGTGGSVGREGPIIQIGSSIGSTVGQFFNVSNTRMKTLVGCGAAAGIAAAFNAPIAGALFAVEIILMDFAIVQFSPIVISSVVATVVSHQFEGNFAAFQVPEYALVSPYELGFYFILGILSGVVSWLFIKVLYYFEHFFDNKFKMPEYLKPAVGGLLIGGIALAYPEIMGVGYDSINNALHGDMIWHIALVLIFVKILATSLTLGSGGSGGIFAPSLFMGASLGAFFGAGVVYLFPEISATPGAYALVAMGGLVAGTTRAPITAIIIVFELTNDYNIILPLMITCIISMILSTKLSRESIYTLKLLMRNIKLKEGAEINVMESIFIRDVYSPEFEAISTKDNFSQVVNHVIQGRGSYFPVVDDNNMMFGVITTIDIKEYLFERESLQYVLMASDIMRTHYKTVKRDDNCQTALDIMRHYDLEGLAVVDESDSGKVIGVIWQGDILKHYHKEIEVKDIAARFASGITMSSEGGGVHFMEGHSIEELQPPASFIGKSIRELNIRAVYNVDVLSIKTRSESGESIKLIPGPDHIISENESLVVAGTIRNINLIKGIE
jgi:chloride channel protein, CIC family